MYLSNMNIHNIHSIHNPNQYSLSSDKVNIPENFAKNMPNALIKVSETQINKNINNNLNNNYLKTDVYPQISAFYWFINRKLYKITSRLITII